MAIPTLSKLSTFMCAVKVTFPLFQLDCCGWEGPKEFAYNNEPIDETCYEKIGQGISGVVARQDDQISTKKMKQVGKPKKVQGGKIDCYTERYIFWQHPRNCEVSCHWTPWNMHITYNTGVVPTFLYAFVMQWQTMNQSGPPPFSQGSNHFW